MSLRIYFDNLQSKRPVSYRLKLLMRRAIEATLRYEGIERDAEVSLTFADDEAIHRLNLKYRGIDRPTDVLSFPLEEDAEAQPGHGLLVLGDIVISLERAAAQAEEYGHSFERETAFLCIHSVLHLLGYDHERGEAEDADMRRRQHEIIDSIGLGIKEK